MVRITLLNDTDLEIVAALNKTKSLSDLSRELAIPIKTISLHIAKLEAMNLIKRTKYEIGKAILVSRGKSFSELQQFIKRFDYVFIENTPYLKKIIKEK